MREGTLMFLPNGGFSGNGAAMTGGSGTGTLPRVSDTLGDLQERQVHLDGSSHRQRVSQITVETDRVASAGLLARGVVGELRDRLVRIVKPELVLAPADRLPKVQERRPVRRG